MIKITQGLTALVKRYKNKYPYMSNTKLSKLIVEEEKLKIESHGLLIVMPTILKPEPQKLDLTNSEECKFKLPESDYREWKPFLIPKVINNLLIISDIHIPYHSNTALIKTLDYAKDRGVNGILINGDAVDFYYQSKFMRIPGMIDIPGEVRMLKQFYEFLRGKFGNDIKIYHKLGNHEDHFYRYLAEHADAIYALPEVQLPFVFEIDKYNIELIEEKKVIRAGKLNIIHGHELFAGGIYVARSIRLKTLENTLTGHFHRTQNDFARSISDKVQGGFSVGCLCGLNPQWMPINNWNHGFAIIETEDDESFEVDNKMIINGKIK